MIVATIVPNNYSMPMDAVKSWLSLPHIYEFNIVQGSCIADNRNRVWNEAKEDEEGILFIDDDIVFTPEDVAKIREHIHTLDAVTGIYGLVGDKIYPCIYGENNKPTPIPEKLEQINASGAGFLGVSSKVVRTLGDDVFSYIEGLKGEDFAFCLRLKKAGYKLWCDPTIKVGHIRFNTITI